MNILLEKAQVFGSDEKTMSLTREPAPEGATERERWQPRAGGGGRRERARGDRATRVASPRHEAGERGRGAREVDDELSRAYHTPRMSGSRARESRVSSY